MKDISIIVCLVTCSRDKTRGDLAVQVMKNLSEKLVEANLQNDFILFDNASLFKNHIALVPSGGHIVESPENTGYWTAIQWILDNYKALTNKSYDYIYMVESDLFHTDLKPLKVCAEFLEKTPSASCVRTQEFSVKNRWRYDKAFRFLPFRKLRSLVHMHNDVTKEKAWFKKSKDVDGIYLSNLHAKLPALNRIDAMKKVFETLSKMDGFSEPDFFKEMYALYPHIGVYDGGLWYQLSTIQTKDIVSGSYTSIEELSKNGYQQTRNSKIISVSENLKTLGIK